MYRYKEYRQYTKCIQGIDKNLKIWYGSRSLTRGERAIHERASRTMVWSDRSYLYN